MRPTLHLLVLALPACRGDDCGMPDTHDSAGQSEACAFSFAILTDTHIGEGIDDYGTPGWDDEPDPAITSASEAILAEAVAETNRLASAEGGPSFALVLGDLSDSGERSELLRARALLGELEVPWLPLLGNHDMWPYARDASAGSPTEDQGPSGDERLLEVFADDLDRAAAALPSLILAPAVWDPDRRVEVPFVGYAFTHCGVRFVALDTNTRTHAGEGEPGVGPEAALFDMEGAPWPWFLEDVTQGPGARASAVVVLAHHPFTPSTWTSFDQPSFDQIEADILEHGLQPRIAALFGGHLHVDSEQEGPAGVPVVLTDATKDGGGPRVVTVSASGVLDWQAED